MEDTRILDRDPGPGGAWLVGRAKHGGKLLHLERWRVAPAKPRKRPYRSLCGLVTIEPAGYIASYEEPSSLCQHCLARRDRLEERWERERERDADDTYSCYQGAEDWNGFHDND